MAEKQNPKERLKEITDSIEAGIKELFDSDKYKSYLQTMSRFHKYSLNNTMLISMQKPDATLVAGFNKWRDQFSRNVKKGERGIKIIAPTPYKTKREQEKLDPDTKAPLLDVNGKTVMEEVEVKIPMFKVVSVFDVEQTEGKPLPELAEDLTGDVTKYPIFLEALKRTSPVPIGFEHMTEQDGYFNIKDQRIAIRDDMSEVQTISAVIHEIAHSKLHNPETEIAETTNPAMAISRRTKEVQAESISFAVCNYYGIKTDENSFGYIASWSKGKELAELRSSLETINKTASELIKTIDQHFAEISKEREVAVIPEQLAYQVGELFFSVQTVEDGYDYSIYDKDCNLLDGGVYDNPDITIYEAIDHIVEDDLVSGISALLDREKATLVDYDDLSERADQAFRDSLLQKQTLTKDSDNIKITEHFGTWYVIDTAEHDGETLFLLENEEHGDEAACIIVDGDKNLVLGDVWNGFDDYNEHIAAMELVPPEAPVQGYEYPMPDPTISIGDRNSYGYLSDELLPLSKERAAELFSQDLTVYMLYEDNTEAMVFELEDIENHNGIFGIEKVDWLALQEHEETKGTDKPSPELSEQLFLEHSKDAFAIYQLGDSEELRDYRFEGLDWLKGRDLSVERDNYNFVYYEPFTQYASQRDRLEEIWERFNINHPADFKGHSLSVSDIIAIKQGDDVTFHYCDSFGFTEVPQLMEQKPLLPDNLLTGDKIETPRGRFSVTDMTQEQMRNAGYGFHHSSDNGEYLIMGNGTRAFTIRNEDNPLRTAEMSTEQNYNQIDGIINNQPTVAELEATVKAGGTISLLDLANAVNDEKKKSVMEQLKATQPKGNDHPKPHKNKEQEI